MRSLAFENESKPNPIVYVKAVLIALSPNLYGAIIIVLSFFWIGAAIEQYEETNSETILLLIRCAMVMLLMLILPIQNSIVTIKSYTLKEAITANFVMRLLFFPVYIICIVLVFLGFIASVWGRPVMFFALLVGFATCIIASVSSVGCAVKVIKEKLFPTPIALLLAFCSVIFSFDLICAIVYLFFGVIKKKGALKEKNLIHTINKID